MRLSRLGLIRRPFLLALMVAAACSTGRTGQQGRPGRPDVTTPGGYLSGQAPDLNGVYTSMGLLAPAGQMPFVASLSFLQGPSPDSTLVLVSMSLPSRAFNFVRDNDMYTATYNVRLELRQGQTVVQQFDAKESVRVATFKETARTDESVIWQQYLRVAPGKYQLTLGVKDANVIRNTAQEVDIVIPRIVTGMVGSPIPVYQAIPRNKQDSLPRLLARPRSSASFSTDSILPVYVEAAGMTGPTRVTASIIAEGNTMVWQDSITLNARAGNIASNTLIIPVRSMGIGVVTLNVARNGSADTSRTHLFVTLGEDLPIASFEVMLRYLKYFASSERLRALRDAPTANRSQAWADFLKATDPIPATSENEGLRDYFNRIRAANIRFKDDGLIGWMTDRGTAYVGLGEPDNIYDVPTDAMQRARQQIWEYTQPTRLRLVYIDNTGLGRYRLTTSAMAELESAIRRNMAAR